jgi:hypothetical protein|tara:strand:+ start:323 stop:556 length:234 start_codon:yes stop_codon:yes gene_type:complete
MTEWNLFEPDLDSPHAIIVFDDGLDPYKKKENIWYICGSWKGKVRLVNQDQKTYINSISSWKIIKHINTNLNNYTLE